MFISLRFCGRCVGRFCWTPPGSLATSSRRRRWLETRHWARRAWTQLTTRSSQRTALVTSVLTKIHSRADRHRASEGWRCRHGRLGRCWDGTFRIEMTFSVDSTDSLSGKPVLLEIVRPRRRCPRDHWSMPPTRRSSPLKSVQRWFLLAGWSRALKNRKQEIMYSVKCKHCDENHIISNAIAIRAWICLHLRLYSAINLRKAWPAILILFWSAFPCQNFKLKNCWLCCCFSCHSGSVNIGTPDANVLLRGAEEEN